MVTKIEARAPRVRCYECGSVDLAVLCHHCGRGLCRKHTPKAVKQNGRPVSAEYTDLGLEKSGPAFHCVDCAHVVPHRLTRFMVGAVVVAVVGVLLLFASVGLGLVLMLIGAAVIGGCLMLGKSRLDEAIRTRPALPVVPSISERSIREHVRGTLSLDPDGTYRSSVSPVEGKLTIDMAIGRQDLERVDLYRKKFRQAVHDPLRFSAGFVALDGPVGLMFLDEPARRTVLDLTYDVAGHPLFMPASARGSGEWTLELSYRLLPADEIELVPIWLTPSFVREQDQRALELELQWSDFGREDNEPTIDRIDTLRLYVPISWGNLESISPDATVGIAEDPNDPGNVLRQVEFSGLSVADYEENGRVRFSMRFEKEIQQTDVVSGELVVSFRNSLSGVSNLHVFHPLGEHRRLGSEDLTVRTEVAATFRLCLDRIRYQDLRMVPDQSKSEDRDRNESVVVEEVIPDHETVIDLTNELSRKGYYVKRVIENPPRTGGSADVVNRIWDIAGRRYDSVYPVDFHLVLTGEEFHEGAIRARTGNTMVQITAQGAYTRAVLSGNGVAGLEEQIIATWEHLREAAVTTLERRATRAAEMPRHRPPRWSSSSTANEEGAAPPRAGENTADRAAWLHKQLEAATAAVINREITESTYQSIRLVLQRELDKLDEE